MSLPKIAAPTFELIQPSTGKALQYRPYLVREEKILLTAKESGDSNDIFNAIRKVISNCVENEDFNVDDIPIFDMEYIFIKLRAKSVNNKIEFVVTDSDDGQQYDFELDLEEVEMTFPEEHDKKIMITDDIGIMMKYPTPKIQEHIRDLKNMTDITFETLSQCIDCVFDGEEIYPWSDYSEKERSEFIDNFSIQAYNKISKFFDTAPKLEHVVHYTNSEGKEKRVIFRSLDDFFTLT